VDPARIARTEGLDVMVISVNFERPAVVQLAEETQPRVEAAHGESSVRSKRAWTNTAVAAVGALRYFERKLRSRLVQFHGAPLR